MKKSEIILMQAFAVAVSYLILSLPFVYSYQVNIFTPGGQKSQAVMASFPDLIQKSYAHPYINNEQFLELQLEKKADPITKVYIYRCRTLSPEDCIKNNAQPIIYVGQDITVDETFKWSDLQVNNQANFLILAKFDIAGEKVWTGTFDIVTQIGIGQFSVDSYGNDDMELYLNEGVAGQDAVNYIETYHKVPLNYVNNTIFRKAGGSDGVTKLEELSGDSIHIDPASLHDNPVFLTQTVTGSEFSEASRGVFSREWFFVFPANTKSSSPVVFYNGGGTEPPANVSGGYLVIDTWTPQITSCGSSDIITVNAHAENATDLGLFTSYYYAIDGVEYTPGSIQCLLVNPATDLYTYICSIKVSDLPACNAPGTSTIRLYFSYEGGKQISDRFTVTLKEQPPSMSVKSLLPNPFDCGIDSQLTAGMQINNEPAGEPATEYTFDGVNYNTMSCQRAGSSYTCTINEDRICPLLQQDLDLTFRFTYGSEKVASTPASLYVTFPPPSLGIDLITPDTIIAGQNSTVKVQAHVRYPSSVQYAESDFNYKYANGPYQPVTCTKKQEFSNVVYYDCSIPITPAGAGVDTLSLRLDAFQNGQPKPLYANRVYYIQSPPPEPSLRIVSSSGMVYCPSTAPYTVQAKAENVQGTPQTYYSIDGGQTFETATCTGTSVVECTISGDAICAEKKASLTLFLKFTYPAKTVLSNSQKIPVQLPTPNMQVYSVFPDAFYRGKTSQASVLLYIEAPEMVSSPQFRYSYLDKSGQPLSCSKVSHNDVLNRDYYECSNAQFVIPSDYSSDQLSVLFSIQGTALTYPHMHSIANAPVVQGPELSILTTAPANIRFDRGTTTTALVFARILRAVENSLGHTVQLIPSGLITSGSCEETNSYEYTCNVTLTAQQSSQAGAQKAVVHLTAQGAGKSYDLQAPIDVEVTSPAAGLNLQSVSPSKLYCPGQTQTNPASVQVSTITENLAGPFSIQAENVYFNGNRLLHQDRYCTVAGSSVSCSIPSEDLISKVGCGQGDLAPGKSSHYYPFEIELLLKKGTDLYQVRGTKDIEVQPTPLKAYLTIQDEEISGGVYTKPIDCLTSNTLKLGDGAGYIRLEYADLLHTQPEDDLQWSFTLNAQDDSGKLTRGAGVSPSENSTICKLKTYQNVQNHRYEDYECSFYLINKLFQRCSSGSGTLDITALSTSMGKTAKGTIKTEVIRGDQNYNIQMIVVDPKPPSDLDCQLQNYDGRCTLASSSRMNVTLDISNAGPGDISDIKADFDIALDRIEATKSGCAKLTADGNRWRCNFGIEPTYKIDESVEKEQPGQTFEPVPLGSYNLTVYVTYANGLARQTFNRNVGDLKLHPKKSDSLISMENQMIRMKGIINDVKSWMSIIFRITGFCATCAIGEKLWSKMDPKEEAQIRTDVCFDPQNPSKSGGMDMVKFSSCMKENNDKPEFRNHCTELAKGNKPALGTDECNSAVTAAKNKDWTGAILALVAYVAIIAYIAKFIGDEFNTNELTDSLKTGMQLGLVCIILSAIGDAKNSEGVEKFAGSLGNGCTWIIKNWWVLQKILSLMINWMLMMECFERVDQSIQAGYGNSQYPELYGTAQGVSSAYSQMSFCMGSMQSMANDAQSISTSVSTFPGWVSGTVGVQLQTSAGVQIASGSSSEICNNPNAVNTNLKPPLTLTFTGMCKYLNTYNTGSNAYTVTVAEKGQSPCQTLSMAYVNNLITQCNNYQQTFSTYPGTVASAPGSGSMTITPWCGSGQENAGKTYTLTVGGGTPPLAQYEFVISKTC